MKYALLIASIVAIGITICLEASETSGPNWLLFLSLIMYAIFVIAAWMSMGIPISSLPRQLLSYSILLGPPLYLIVAVINISIGLVIPMPIQTVMAVTPIPILCIFAIAHGQNKTGHIITPWTFAAIWAITIMQPTMPAYEFLLAFCNISRIKIALAVLLAVVLLSTLLLGVIAALKDRKRAMQMIAATIASTGIVLSFVIWAVDILRRK